MDKWDEVIAKCNRALALAREIEIAASTRRIIFQQRLIGLLIGIVLVGAVYWVVK